MQNRTFLPPRVSWDDLRILLAAARTGSFTTAGRSLGAAQTTIGRRVRALETSTGAKLFDRRYDGMYLTPAGKEVLEHLELMEQAAARVERVLVGVDQGLEGTVRVTATDGLGSHWLTPRMIEFQRRYPGVQVEVIAASKVLSLGSRDADIAIRLARPVDPKMVGLEVGLMRFELFCAKQYADAHGAPTSLEEVRLNHAVVDHHPYATLPMWRTFTATHRRIVYRSNSSISFLQAVRSGAGIGLLPRFYRVLDPDLVVLDIEVDCALPIWMISHLETNKNARTQVLWKYLKDIFRKDRAAWFS